jgi:hypothetical protein
MPSDRSPKGCNTRRAERHDRLSSRHLLLTAEDTLATLLPVPQPNRYRDSRRVCRAASVRALPCAEVSRKRPRQGGARPRRNGNTATGETIQIVGGWPVVAMATKRAARSS